MTKLPSAPASPPPTYAYVAIHIAALFFGLAGIFGALIEASAEFITMARALFAFLVLGLLLSIFRQPFFSPALFRQKQQCLSLVGAIFCLGLHWLSFFIAIKKGGVAVATLGFASFPAFTTLIEYIFGREPMQRHDIWSILLISIGLLLVNPSFSMHDQMTVGLLWGIVSGFSFALFAYLNRGLSHRASALQIAFWQNLGVCILYLPWAWSASQNATLNDWFWAALLGLFCTALAHYLIIRSLQHLKARHAGIVIALEPVYAIFFAALLFQQYPSLRMLIGAFVIIGTIIWSQRQQQTKKTRP